MKSILVKIIFGVAVAFVILFMSHQAHAWDGTGIGKIGQMNVTNNGVTVYLEGQPVICNSPKGEWFSKWAVIYEADSNYQAYVSTALAAKLSGSQVVLYVTIDANDYCHLGYLTVY